MIRMLPGPDGEDSPDVDSAASPLDYPVWQAWLRIEADRAAGRRTPLRTIGTAARTGPPDHWGLWWHRQHPGGELTHRAGLVGVRDGGIMLVSACGYTTPARADVNAHEIGLTATRDPHRTYCIHCSSPP